MDDYNANVAWVRIKDIPGEEDKVVSIVVDRWHDNVKFIIGEDLRLNPEKDRADFIRGFIGSYPNYFFVVSAAELPEFFDFLDNFDNTENSIRKLKRFGVNRADPRFWEVYDWFQKEFDKRKELRPRTHRFEQVLSSCRSPVISILPISNSCRRKQASVFSPRPIVALKRLSQYLGGPELFMKRDDQSGLAMGGNKVRKLEYLVGDALAAGADVLVTGGAAQSNHCRQTAAAAAAVGLECHLALGGEEPPVRGGNLLLDSFFRARIHWCGEQRKGETIPDICEQLRRDGRNPYVVPYGGSNVVGALGFVAAGRRASRPESFPETTVFPYHLCFKLRRHSCRSYGRSFRHWAGL